MVNSEIEGENCSLGLILKGAQSYKPFYKSNKILVLQVLKDEKVERESE